MQIPNQTKNPQVFPEKTFEASVMIIIKIIKNFVLDLNRIYTLQCYFVATLFLHKFFQRDNQ